MATVPESVRSRAWSAAKPIALQEWNRTVSGDLDEPARTNMLIAVSRALDAALAAVYVETDADVARRRLVEEFGYPNRTYIQGTDEREGELMTDREAIRALEHEERMRYLETGR